MRQRSDKQETTMARAGTSPSYLKQKEIQLVEPVILERSDFEKQHTVTIDFNGSMLVEKIITHRKGPLKFRKWT